MTPEMKEARECIKKLTKVIDDILPQMGKLVLQDYAALNDGLIMARRILAREDNAEQ